MQLSQQCIWNSLFGGCVGIPPEFREVWHQTNSTRTWRPWSVTPKALSCLTLWSSVHQWRRCGRSLVANRWDLVEVEGGLVGLVDYFTHKIGWSFTIFTVSQDSMIVVVVTPGGADFWLLQDEHRSAAWGLLHVRLHQGHQWFWQDSDKVAQVWYQEVTVIHIHIYFIVELGMTSKVMVQHLPWSQICCLFCAVPGALEHQLWKQRTQHPPKTTESILRGAKFWQVWFQCWHLQERTCQECEISRMIEGYGGIWRDIECLDLSSCDIR